jgi:GxxExxY protein
MEVHRALGPGFIESIYHRALVHELGLRGLSYETEVEIAVRYKNQLIGQHRLDIVVKTVIIELKAVSAIVDIHVAQTLSYLKATNMEVALIMNFGLPSLDVEKADKKPRIARITRIYLSQVFDSCTARRLRNSGALCTSILTIASSWMR